MINISIIGNLIKDVEIKDVNGKRQARFTVAVSDKKVEKTTTFFNCTKYLDPQSKIADYLTKGSKLYVSGDLSITVREVEGKTYVNNNVYVKDLTLLAFKKNEGENVITQFIQESDDLPF